MKKLFNVSGIIFAAAIIVCAMAACELLNPETPQSDQTPVAGDYDVGNLTQSVGSVTAVTISPRSGKSTGARTIHYAGTGSTTYANSTTLPTAAGTYTVTFDVAAVTGWKAATGLYAGTLTIGTLTPVAGDFVISRLMQTAGSVTAVTVTPKAGKSTGAIKIYYEGTGSTTYSKSETVPATGTSGSKYTVTFDVAASTGWNAVTGLSAGTLELNDNRTPDVADYNISGTGTVTYNGSAKTVTVTAKTDRQTSPGAVTVKYSGSAGDSTTAPSAAGKYTVTFDVAAATGWNPATLVAGTLTINSAGQAQTLSVSILGTPKVGNKLTADVLKSIPGENKYQWLSGGQIIDGETNSEFVPGFEHAGKAISVKVTCGDESDTSEAVTIQLEYTVKINRYANNLYANAQIGNQSSFGSSGFTYQWFKEGQSIQGATSSSYVLNSGDISKKFKASITFNSQTVTSTEFLIPTVSSPAGTTWKAVNTENGKTYTYTLSFNNDSTCKMGVEIIDLQTSNNVPTDNPEVTGTYTQNLFLISFVFAGLEEYGNFTGDIDGNKLYLYGEGDDLTFTKQ